MSNEGATSLEQPSGLTVRCVWERPQWQGLIAALPDLHIEPGRHLRADDAVVVGVTSAPARANG